MLSGSYGSNDTLAISPSRLSSACWSPSRLLTNPSRPSIRISLPLTDSNLIPSLGHPELAFSSRCPDCGPRHSRSALPVHAAPVGDADNRDRLVPHVVEDPVIAHPKPPDPVASGEQPSPVGLLRQRIHCGFYTPPDVRWKSTDLSDDPSSRPYRQGHALRRPSRPTPCRDRSEHASRTLRPPRPLRRHVTSWQVGRASSGIPTFPTPVCLLIPFPFSALLATRLAALRHALIDRLAFVPLSLLPLVYSVNCLSDMRHLVHVLMRSVRPIDAFRIPSESSGWQKHCPQSRSETVPQAYASDPSHAPPPHESLPLPAPPPP